MVKNTLSKENISNYINIQKNIMNEKRLQILLLLQTEQKSWSQLMQELDLRNPKLLHDHISTLRLANLIEKNDKGFYQNTKFGETWLTANIKLMNTLNKNDQK
ncbi:Putative transcriptional regulator [Nitrosotalea devaniterrae]|uniref:Transcriptional regulator n=1 Tax=Nitrosotalea devaniterrae TaxID=1078905 RepID=A0A128A1W4_9ARCH|nr:Putative transcriptional regulator [Candidatus Nitrosotalea devanaterra]